MKTRFIRSIAKTAQTTDVAMPWTRGSRRAAFIVKRTTPQTTRRSA